MKLTINKSPSWWVLEEKTGWKYYEPRFDVDVPCVDGLNMVKGFACYFDVGTQTVADLTNTEWLYKMYNYYVDKIVGERLLIIADGVANEVRAFGEMLQCFPCG